MIQKETHILIATGGYLNDKVVVEKIHLTDDDEAFIEDEFEDFGEYVDYVLEEAAAEHEQPRHRQVSRVIQRQRQRPTGSRPAVRAHLRERG